MKTKEVGPMLWEPPLKEQVQERYVTCPYDGQVEVIQVRMEPTPLGPVPEILSCSRFGSDPVTCERRCLS
jgi:hypothetical protein